MMEIANITVWVNDETKQIIVRDDYFLPERGHWSDPIGKAYTQWQQMTDAQRIRLMLETAIDLAMQGIPLRDVLRAFFEVKQFRALGGASYPMCRALTSAVLGKCLEPNTMTFEELLEHYR